METFLMGAIAMACGTAGLFFLRFWKETGDRLFAIFAVAFWLLALTRLGTALSFAHSETDTEWHWARFAVFLLILLAIIDKNFRRD